MAVKALTRQMRRVALRIWQIAVKKTLTDRKWKTIHGLRTLHRIHVDGRRKFALLQSNSILTVKRQTLTKLEISKLR